MKRILIIGMASKAGGIESFLINVYRRINRKLIHFDFQSPTKLNPPYIHLKYSFFFFLISTLEN